MTPYQRDERRTVTYRVPAGRGIPVGTLRRALADAEAEYRLTHGVGPLPDDWAYLLPEPDALVVKFRTDPPPDGPRVLDVVATQVLPRTTT